MAFFSKTQLCSILFYFFLWQANLSISAHGFEEEEEVLLMEEEMYEETSDKEASFISQVILKTNNGFIVPIVTSLIVLACIGKLWDGKVLLSEKALISLGSIGLSILVTILSLGLHINDLITSALLFSVVHCATTLTTLHYYFEESKPEFKKLADSIITYFLGYFLLFFFLKLIFIKKEEAGAASLLLQKLFPTMLRIMVAGLMTAALCYASDLQKWAHWSILPKFLMKLAGTSLFLGLMYYYFCNYQLYTSFLEDVTTYAVAGMASILFLTVISGCSLGSTADKLTYLVIPYALYSILILALNLIDDESSMQFSFEEIYAEHIIIGATSTFFGILAMLYCALLFFPEKLKEDSLLISIGQKVQGFLFIIIVLSVILLTLSEVYVPDFLEKTISQYLVVMLIISFINIAPIYYFLEIIMKEKPSVFGDDEIVCYAIFILITFIMTFVGKLTIDYFYMNEIDFADFAKDFLSIFISIMAGTWFMCWKITYNERPIKGLKLFLGIIWATCLSLLVNYYWQVFVLRIARKNHFLQTILYILGFVIPCWWLSFIFITKNHFLSLPFIACVFMSKYFMNALVHLVNVFVLNKPTTTTNKKDRLG